MNHRFADFSLSIAVFVSVVVTGMLTPTESVRAAIEQLSSGERGQPGRMTIRSDEFGAFGFCDQGLASFIPDAGTRSRNWMCSSGLMLTDGNEFLWLGHEAVWTVGLSGRNVVSDAVNDARTVRTSKFNIDQFDLEVDLVQQTPTSGYNFVQSYVFTNTGRDAVSLSAVWFNDQDLGFEQTAFDNRVGFVPGDVPRVYFIEESDVAGPGDPGIDDRDRRISLATEMGDGVAFDGYLGVKPPGREGGAGNLSFYLERSHGILEQDLNTIQELRLGRNVEAPTGVNLDTDGDGLIDSAGDVAAAIQFSMHIPIGGSTSLAFDYIGGNLSNAVFDLAIDAKALQAGDADQDFDFDQLDLVQVQIGAKYLNGQAATWGEGDWNGAPGGSQGSPPVGDGHFNQLDIIAALAPGHYLTGPYSSLHPNGQQGDGQTSMIYNAHTGELAFDAPAGIELTSINIDSAAGVFLRNPAQNLGGSFDNDADNNIFKATFGGSFGSLSFGNVAQSGLAEQLVLNDLTVIGSLAGGGELGDVDLIYVPEPASVVLTLAGLLAVPAYVRTVRRPETR